MLHPEDEKVFDLHFMTVKGKIKLSDALHQRRVLIDRTSSVVDVSLADLVVQFSLPDSSYPTFVPDTLRLDDAIREAVVWGRPAGQREKNEHRRGATCDVKSDGSFECQLIPGEYESCLAMLFPEPKSSDGQQADTPPFSLLARNIATVFPPDLSDSEDQNNVVDLGEIDIPLMPVPDDLQAPADHPALDDFASRPHGRHPTVVSDDIERPSDDWNPKPSRQNEFDRPAPIKSSEAPIDIIDFDPFNRSSTPSPTNAANTPAATTVDVAIAKLVTDLLAAGDRRTRENLKAPLQELLEKKFDAEQQARETLLKDLTERLNEATRQVKERSQQKDRIIKDQLDRMINLPEDSFLPMEPPADSPFHQPPAKVPNQDLGVQQFSTGRTTRQALQMAVSSIFLSASSLPLRALRG
ncbi:MAG: hypothetical protein R3C49_14340 [Planctomycetaceae bacterium]